MSRSVTYRLIALLVVALLGVYYIVFDAVGVHLWNTPYKVTVMLPSGGGIYSDAAVTYRGVQIGKVSSLHLQPGDVRVELAINHGTRIPADVHASVKELTAAAEQYMELTPAGAASGATRPANGGYLQADAVIPMSRTSVPTSVGTLLDTVNQLVDSVHASNLNTIATALAQGLNQAGPDLREIINDAQTLIQALNSVVPSTVTAIQAGHGVLSTLDATSTNFDTLATGLDRLSQTVAQDDAQLRGVLTSGDSAATAVYQQVLFPDRANLEGVINGFSDTAGLANARQGAVQALFEILPVASSDAAMTVSGGGSGARFQLSINTRNTVCPYTSTMAEPTSLVATGDLTRDCSTSAPDLLQRGAQTAPTPNRGTP